MLAQTFRDFELLLIDDGSTDGSREIAEAYAAKDARVRLVRHRWNQGTAASYNTGLECSRGAYVAFVDADDLVAPEYLAVLRQASVASGADCVAAGYHVFQERLGDGKRIVWSQEPVWLGATAQDRLHVFLPATCLHIAPWCKLYRKAFLDEHRMAFCSPGIAPDVLFHVECLAMAEHYLVLPEVLYHYRQRPDSVDHARGHDRAKAYAQAMPVIMNALDVWMRKEHRLTGAPALRRMAAQYLYLFLLMNLQKTAKDCSPLEAARLLQAAMEETPSRALQEAMVYAAVRVPIAKEDTEFE